MPAFQKFNSLPPCTNVEEKLVCPPTLDNISAIQACEAAAVKSGYCIAARTKRSLVLMPGPRRALLTCLASGVSRARDSHAGRGITAELVPSDSGETLAVSVTTPAGGKRRDSQNFISALQNQLNSGNSPSSSSSSPKRTDETVTELSASRFKSELAAYYYFSKLLLSEKEAPGVAAAQFVQRFSETYRSVKPTEVQPAQPMRECMAAVDQLSRLVDELVADLDADALANVAEMKPFLRGSVERCLFGRVGRTLWQLYEGRHSADDTKYAQKVHHLSRFSDARLLDALGVRSQFRGLTQREEEQISGGYATANGGAAHPAGDELLRAAGDADLGHGDISADNGRTLEGQDEYAEEIDSPESHSPGSLSENSAWQAGLGGPYERAVASLSQVEILLLGRSGRSCTPREATEALTFSQFEMKTCVLEATGGETELRTMDDILPLFVFILVRSALTKPFACAQYMNDSLSRDESLESEGRAVLLLESAARHVAYDWDIEDLLPQSVSPQAVV